MATEQATRARLLAEVPAKYERATVLLQKKEYGLALAQLLEVRRMDPGYKDVQEDIAFAEAGLAGIEKGKADERAKRRAQALGRLKSHHDEFKNITWYSARSVPEVGKYVQVYFGVSQGGLLPLRLKCRYEGESWLFVESVTVRADGQQFTLAPSFERDNSSTVWEWFDTSVGPEELAVIEAIASSRKAVIRFQGKQYYSDFVVPSSQKEAVRTVLEAYWGAKGA